MSSCRCWHRPDTAPLAPFFTLTGGQTYFVRLRFTQNRTGELVKASVALKWAAVKPGTPPPPPSAFTDLPTNALAPPPTDHPQLIRIALQRDAASGWGSWYRESALAVTLLPEGSTVTTGLCQRSTGDCMDPTAAFTPEQDRGQEEPRSDGALLTCTR